MVNIYIQGQLLDQYNDEDVEVVSQVLDIKDITKIKGDYSKTFNLPASKTNNRIFKHWYNIGVDGGFDARVKAEGSIDIDGIPFKKGKFKLNKAVVKNGIVTSYTVVFFGNVTSLKDIVGESKLSDLNFTSLDFLYNYASVTLGLKTDATDLYPEIVFTPSSKKRLFYGADDSHGDGEAFSDYNDAIRWQRENNQHNIAYASNTGGGTPSNKAIGLSWVDIEASLRCDKIIDAIETTFPELSFTRDFFDTTEFKRLYMLMSNSEGRPQLKQNLTRVNYVALLDYDGTGANSSDDTLTSLGSNITSYDNAPVGSPLVTQLSLVPKNTNSTSEVRVRLYVNKGDGQGYQLKQTSEGTCSRGDVATDITEFKTAVVTTRQLLPDPTDLKHYYEVDTLNGEDVYCELWQSTAITNSYYTYGIENFAGTFDVAMNVPEMKVIDFLKGLFNMFKLVVVPREDGSLYINTLNSFYSQGTKYDISKYISRSSLEVKQGEVVGSVDLKSKPSESVMNYGFRQNYNREYGDFKIEFEDGDGNSIDGKAIELTTPFETLVFERLRDINSGDITNIQLGQLVDKEFKALNTGPVLHYVSIQSQENYPIGWIDQANNMTELDDDIYIPCHTLSISDAFTSIIFNKEFSTWNGSYVEKTLYTNYYESYIDGIKGIRSRVTSVTAKLPTLMSANLSMNDVLTIDGIDYRINSLSYNLLTGLTKLQLINGLDTQLQPFNGAPGTLFVAMAGDEFQFNLPNADDYSFTKLDTGDGTSWFTPSTSYESSRGENTHNSFNLDVDAYTGPLYGFRSAYLEFTYQGVTTNMQIVQELRKIEI